MAKKNKKLTSDNINITYDGSDAGWSEGLLTGGVVESASVQGFDYSASFGDLGDIGQLDLFSEEEMQEKYPALKQAHEHYKSVLEICKTKEKEDNED